MATQDPLAPPEATPREVPSLATAEAEAARREVLRLATAADLVRARISPEAPVPERAAASAGRTAGFEDRLSPEPPPEVVQEVLALPIRRAYAEGLLLAITQRLVRAVEEWRAAILAALPPAGVAVDALLAQHRARRVEATQAAGRELAEATASLPVGAVVAQGWIPPAEAAWQEELARLESLRTHLLGVRSMLATWRPTEAERLRAILTTARLGPVK